MPRVMKGCGLIVANSHILVPAKCEGGHIRIYKYSLLNVALRYTVVTHRKCIAKHMINHRISADWSTTKPIAAFSCTPRVQEVHTKAEVVHLSPGLLSLGVLFNCHA